MMLGNPGILGQWSCCSQSFLDNSKEWKGRVYFSYWRTWTCLSIPGKLPPALIMWYYVKKSIAIVCVCVCVCVWGGRINGNGQSNWKLRNDMEKMSVCLYKLIWGQVD